MKFSDIFNAPKHIEGKGWYIVRKDTDGKRYLHQNGEIIEGVYPDGYHKTYASATRAGNQYIQKNKER